jgi:hypothetical protein
MTTLSMTFRRRVSEETRSWVSVARAVHGFLYLRANLRAG